MEQAIIEAHELVDRPNETTDWTELDQGQHSLPRPDGGKDAWLFLCSCFILEALVWGMPFSYGVFQTHYTANFASASSSIAAIGTSQTGIMYLSTPLLALLMQRWPRLRRLGMYAGAVIAITAMVAASFCNSVSGLLATQGVMYAIGGMTLYYPAMVYVDEWFVARKGTAYGVMWAGTGSAGVVVPFLLQWLLDSYGFRVALRVWAVVLVVGITPCLFWVKPRLPITSSNALRPVNFGFMKHPPFWIFLAGVVFQSLSFFLPPLWLPSFAAEIGLPKFAGPLGLAVINLANCFGAPMVGWLVDRFHVSVALSITTLGQVVAIFVFWGLTSSQAMFYMFALTFGLFGGGFSSTWSRYAPAMEKQSGNERTEAGLVLSLMCAGRGIGAVITGPLSEALLEGGWSSRASFAYGTDYGVLILFSGVFATLGGTACVGRLLKLL
ncbi:uncharacterized protein LTR77_003040 [Saxophila tyrrhenica]|uniref:Major facilitator superfamily (MFS) profile domain-containing protein n=1 Tax=Saxophila tyrrhenica TaxID=1690608 RepID=A0AAV9PHZ7_9PEZI|nr:hypothetical protein LTR77_003040 [Saxophila tyrrhenica]